MIEKFNRKPVKKWLSLVLVLSIICTFVIGDHYIGARESNNQTKEVTSNSSIVKETQLKEMDELELAKTDTNVGKLSENLQDGYLTLLDAYENGKDFDHAVEEFTMLVEQLKTQTMEELEKTDNGTEEYNDYRSYVLSGFDEIKKYAEKINTKNAEKMLGKIEEKVAAEKPYIPLAEDLPFENVSNEEIETEEYVAKENGEYEVENTKYTQSNLKSTNDTVINDAIRSEFEELTSPLEIYQFVKNNYMTEFYYGSRKGAIGAFEQKAGNDYDLASLFIGVLRDRDIPARYVRGEIEITAEQAIEWTAADNIHAALRMLSSLGIPVTSLIQDGEVVAVRIEHVWVEAYVPYTDYRGAGNQAGESLWIPLDVSFKEVKYLDGIDLTSLSDYMNDENNYLSADAEIYGVSVENLASIVSEEDSAIVKYLLENGYGDSSIEEIVGGGEIVNEDLGYLPMTLPYTVQEKIESFDDIPLSLTDNISFSLAGNSAFDLDFEDKDSIDYTLYTPDVYGKRIILSYTPATDADKELLEQYGGLFQTPAYLLKMKPQLIIDGKVVAEGDICNAGYTQKYAMNIRNGSPNKNDSTIENSIVVGGIYCIALDYGTVSVEELQRVSKNIDILKENTTEENVYTDYAMGELLNGVAKTYFSYLDMYNRIVAGQNNVTSTRDLSIGIVGFNVNVVYTFNRPTELNEAGIFLDIGHDVHSVVSNDNNNEAEKMYMLQSGIYASAMEHGILEEITGIESVSTIKVLEYAAKNNIPIHSITKENLAEEITKLDLSDQLKSEIRSSVNAGKVVIIPEKEITINQWSGIGYMVLDPDTFACGYMISGGMAGGSMTAFQVVMEVFLNVALGLGTMVICMILAYFFPVLIPIFAVVGYISIVCSICNIATHLVNFIDTGEVIEFQKAMIELSTLCFLVGIGSGLSKVFKNIKETEKIEKVNDEVSEVTEKVKDNKCFIAGTLVLTADGLVAIEEIAEGDIVLSFNPETEEVSEQIVEATFIKECKELVHIQVEHEEISATPDHPFYVPQKGFVKAVDLRAGDILCTVNGEYVIVEKIQHEILESPVKVYNFRVANHHTYFVGNASVGVHNSGCGGPTDGSNEGGSGSRNLIDDMDEIAEDIININKQYSDGFELNNSIKNILNSASYYDDQYEQVAAITRSITDHAFANGNKRTAFDTLNMLLDDFGLSNALTDSQKWDLIYDIAEGRIDDVTEIANILKGK